MDITLHNLSASQVLAVLGALGEAPAVSVSAPTAPKFSAPPVTAPASPVTAPAAPASPVTAPAAPAAPAAPKPPAAPKAPAAPAAPKAPAEAPVFDPQDEENAQSMLGAMVVGAEYSIADLRGTLEGWDQDTHIKPALQVLIASGAVVQSGLARGTRYTRQ